MCIVTFFVPCYTFGKNAEAVGESCLLCGLSMCIPPVDLVTRTIVRGKIRDQKGIDGSVLGDFCCHLFLYPCALMQEHREMKSPKAGYMGRE